MSLLTEELKAHIGRREHFPALEPLGAAGIRYFAIAVGDPDPLYCDDAYAQTQGYPSRIAPPTFVVETNQYAHAAPRANGYFPHEWDLPVKGFRTIRGGNDYEFMRPVLPEDEISVTLVLESIEEKTSRDGRGQLLVTSLATYTDAAGETVATNRELTFLKLAGGSLI
jgi:acyl dehydratase